MARRPSRPVRLLASALATGALLTTAACSDDGDQESGPAGVTASPVAERSPAARQLPALTEAQALAALITEADIEDDWTQVRQTEAANWQDALLIGKVDVADFVTARADAADCQRLLDALFDDNLLGRPAGASALRGFQQDDSRLLYQVASYERTDPDDSLAWMKTLPDKCDQFTATDEGGDRRTVQVVDAPLPDVGDARQGLRVTVKGTAAGEPATLTLDVAAVRVAADAITVTAGGLDGDEDDSVQQAVKQGTQRLKDVQAGRTPAATPSPVY